MFNVKNFSTTPIPNSTFKTIFDTMTGSGFKQGEFQMISSVMSPPKGKSALSEFIKQEVTNMDYVKDHDELDWVIGKLEYITYLFGRVVAGDPITEDTVVQETTKFLNTLGYRGIKPNINNSVNERVGRTVLLLCVEEVANKAILLQHLEQHTDESYRKVLNCRCVLSSILPEIQESYSKPCS